MRPAKAFGRITEGNAPRDGAHSPQRVAFLVKLAVSSGPPMRRTQRCSNVAPMLSVRPPPRQAGKPSTPNQPRPFRDKNPLLLQAPSVPTPPFRPLLAVFSFHLFKFRLVCQIFAIHFPARQPASPFPILRPVPPKSYAPPHFFPFFAPFSPLARFLPPRPTLFPSFCPFVLPPLAFPLSPLFPLSLFSLCTLWLPLLPPSFPPPPHFPLALRRGRSRALPFYLTPFLRFVPFVATPSPFPPFFPPFFRRPSFAGRSPRRPFPQAVPSSLSSSRQNPPLFRLLFRPPAANPSHSVGLSLPSFLHPPLRAN